MVDDTTTRDTDWFDRIPKVELHVHLEGAIPLEAMWTLVQKYGSEEVASPADLMERFAYRDFEHFIETWVWKNQFLRELDDFTFIAESLARSFVEQNIVHAEVFYSPPEPGSTGFAPDMDIDPRDLTVAIREGFDAVEGVSVLMTCDFVRDRGPRSAARLLEQIAEVSDYGVAGIGIGGSEHSHPPEPFVEVYRRARQLGFHTNAHAGEAAGPASVRGAIETLEAERIGHGVRAIEDEALVETLVERQTPLEMCPISNVRTGVVASLEAHPVREFLARGACVTISSDDPTLFGTTLDNELRELHGLDGVDATTIRDLQLAAVEACWLDDGEKAELRRRVEGADVWRAGPG